MLSYRIYDFEKKNWATNAVVMQNGDVVFQKTKKFPGFHREKVFKEGEYDLVVDLHTGFLDKNGQKIFENDILEVGNVTGLVFWDVKSGEYILLDFDGRLMYPLWDDLCRKRASVIGNIEENGDLLTKSSDDNISDYEIGAWGTVLK